MNEREYYLNEFVLDSKKHYVIWYTGHQDGLLISTSGKLLTFQNLDHAYNFAENYGIDLQTEAQPLYDFDLIEAWCRFPLPEAIKCSEFLDAWNFVRDLNVSIGQQAEFSLADVEMNDIYNKLFWGSNLPAMTPEGEHYTPVWSSEEIDDLTELFKLGLTELRLSI